MAARFTTMPGHLLRRCHQIAVAIFLDACANFDLTPLQFAVLESLYNDGSQDQVTLGGATALDRTTITVVLRNLERRGLLRREKSPRDQRSKIVTISAGGKKLLQDAMPSVEATQQRILAPLDTAETAKLLVLLEKLARNNNALSRAPERRSA
jgi:DNA-binding MarR family transcriptional regulator